MPYIIAGVAILLILGTAFVGSIFAVKRIMSIPHQAPVTLSSDMSEYLAWKERVESVTPAEPLVTRRPGKRVVANRPRLQERQAAREATELTDENLARFLSGDL